MNHTRQYLQEISEIDNHTDFFNIGMNQRTEIESLIQKHKQ